MAPHLGLGAAGSRSALLCRNTGATVQLVIDRDRKRGGVVEIIFRNHGREPQPPRVFLGDRRADNTGRVTDDERHLLSRAKRRRDDQIALPLPVIIIGDDDEFAAGKGLQDFLDRIGHFLNFSLGAESA